MTVQVNPYVNPSITHSYQATEPQFSGLRDWFKSSDKPAVDTVSFSNQPIPLDELEIWGHKVDANDVHPEHRAFVRQAVVDLNKNDFYQKNLANVPKDLVFIFVSEKTKLGHEITVGSETSNEVFTVVDPKNGDQVWRTITRFIQYLKVIEYSEFD